MRTRMRDALTQYQFNIGSCQAPHPLRRANDGIYQRRGEDGPTSAGAPRFAPRFWALTWAEENPNRSPGRPLFPILRCPFRFDIHHSYLRNHSVGEGGGNASSFLITYSTKIAGIVHLPQDMKKQ